MRGSVLAELVLPALHDTAPDEDVDEGWWMNEAERVIRSFVTWKETAPKLRAVGEDGK